MMKNLPSRFGQDGETSHETAQLEIMMANEK
jgi:hypothetical protein